MSNIDIKYIERDLEGILTTQRTLLKMTKEVFVSRKEKELYINSVIETLKHLQENYKLVKK